MNKYHCALELALYVCSEEELAKLQGNNIMDLELNSLTKNIELKAIEKIQKLLNKKQIQGKILGIGNQVLNFKCQHGAKTYNDKQLHVCVVAATNRNNDCHHHNQEGTKQTRQKNSAAGSTTTIEAHSHSQPIPDSSTSTTTETTGPMQIFFPVRHHHES